MTKTIDTLIDDIYSTLGEINSGHQVVSDTKLDEYLDIAVTNIKGSLRNQLTPRSDERDPKKLYASEVGKPCHRAVWYSLKGAERQPLDPKLKIRFMQGDLLEELLALLARVAGHEVTDEQKPVKASLRDGWEVSGRMDYKIDGVVVDAKSASKTAFKKFKDGSMFNQDHYGYLAQLGHYAFNAGEPEKGAGFLAINKDDCELALYQPDPMDMDAAMPDLDGLTYELESEVGPDRAFHDEPYKYDTRYGNRVLNRTCGWCDYKKKCWPEANNGEGLRAFWKKEPWGPTLYYFTHIVKEPKLKEEKDI